MIYAHYSEIEWDYSRWPNFTAREMACSHCGEYFHDPVGFDRLQRMRSHLNRPIHINSAHRCAFHNVAVGGAPLSEHRKIAWDISLHNHKPDELFKEALTSGFTTFGFYQTFLHVGQRPGKRWVSGEIARTQWKNCLALEPVLLQAAGLG